MSAITKEQLTSRRICRNGNLSFRHNIDIHNESLRKIEDHFTGVHHLRRKVLVEYVKRAAYSVLKAESSIRKVIQHYPKAITGPMPPHIQECYQRMLDGTNELLNNYCQYIKDKIDLLDQANINV